MHTKVYEILRRSVIYSKIPITYVTHILHQEYSFSMKNITFKKMLTFVEITFFRETELKT